MDINRCSRVLMDRGGRAVLRMRVIAPRWWGVPNSPFMMRLIISRSESEIAEDLEDGLCLIVEEDSL